MLIADITDSLELYLTLLRVCPVSSSYSAILPWLTVVNAVVNNASIISSIAMMRSSIFVDEIRFEFVNLMKITSAIMQIYYNVLISSILAPEISALDGVAGIDDGIGVGGDGGPEPAVGCMCALNAVTNELWSDLSSLNALANSE